MLVLFFKLLDLEADMGTLDDDMSNLTFQRGFSLLNDDIMALVEQGRPVYEKGEVIENHQKMVNEKLLSLKVVDPVPEKYPTAMEVLALGFTKGKRRDKK